MRTRRNRHTVKVLLGSWLVAFLLASPLAYFSSVTEINRLQCTEKTTDLFTQKIKLSYSVIAMVLQYVLPLFIVTIAYTRICLRIRRRQRSLPRQLSTAVGNPLVHSKPLHQLHLNKKNKCANHNYHFPTDSKKLKRTEGIDVSMCAITSCHHSCSIVPAAYSAPRTSASVAKSSRAIILLTGISIVFGLSWLPTTINNLVADVHQLTLIESPAKWEPGRASNVFLLQMFCLSLILSSACLNPIIYGWLNETFRTEFYHLLRIKRKDQRTSHNNFRKNELPTQASNPLNVTPQRINFSLTNVGGAEQPQSAYSTPGRTKNFKTDDISLRSKVTSTPNCKPLKSKCIKRFRIDSNLTRPGTVYAPNPYSFRPASDTPISKYSLSSLHPVPLAMSDEYDTILDEQEHSNYNATMHSAISSI